MQKYAPLFLKSALAVLGTAVAAVCIFGIPNVIGSFSIGGYDPILIGLYIPAAVFFMAIYQAVKLLNLIERGKAFSLSSAYAFRTIKRCAAFIASVFVLSMPYIFQVADQDDAPGVVALGMVIIFLSLVIATFSGLLQRLVEQAVIIKNENDMTV